MTPSINLQILRERFSQLSSAAYYNPAFKTFSVKIIEVIDHVAQAEDRYPPEIIRALVEQIWGAVKFVSGSRSNDAPHEVQFCLELALAHWIDEQVLISSAALDDLNFFLDHNDLWKFIGSSIDGYDCTGYSPLLVRIAAPGIYKHKPIFCSPLFHELGHFVDVHYALTDQSLITNPIPENSTRLNDSQWASLHKSHRMEHFADVFSACYCGVLAADTLEAIAPAHPASLTHPSTSSRLGVIREFLSGNEVGIVRMYNDLLDGRGLRQLGPFFEIPNVNNDFDDLVPIVASSTEELFGLLAAGGGYLAEQLRERSAPWITADARPSEIETAINDLTEKSMRNFEVASRWQNVSTN